MNTKGFSLLEVMIASSMLFVGIIVVMSSLSSSITINTITEEQNLAITAIANEVEQLKSMGFTELEAKFGGTGSVVPGAYIPFPVPGIMAADGSDNPAMGKITLNQVEDPDGPAGNMLSMEDLIEVRISIEYKSGLDTSPQNAGAGLVQGDVEEVTVWISPKY